MAITPSYIFFYLKEVYNKKKPEGTHPSGFHPTTWPPQIPLHLTTIPLGFSPYHFTTTPRMPKNPLPKLSSPGILS
jgi:hypothetical protein